MGDLKMVETGDGGDYVFNGKDLVFIEGFQNMPYLGLFGGNVESSTKDFLENEQRFDWWANDLLMPNQSVIQMNSLTERLLNTTALTSSTRLQIEQAVKTDMDFLRAFSSIEIETSITANDRIEILVKIQELGTQESTEFVYIWDSTEQELTQQNLN